MLFSSILEYNKNYKFYKKEKENKCMNKLIFKFLLVNIFLLSVKIETRATLEKENFNKASWFKVKALESILVNSPQISYKRVFDKIDFDYPEFFISPKFPHEGYFDELFILTIPQARVQGLCGNILINDNFPDEMVRANRYDCLCIPKLNDHNFLKVPGKVAVIAQHGAGQYWANYYHALCEVFGRLAILEMSGIEYDWLYIPTDKKFVKEILELWGIDFAKIISPTNEYFGIQADELIVPSLVINTSVGHKHAGNFQHPLTLGYIREKLLKAAQNKNIDISHFSKRVFITRKDSYNARRILNEDEVFALFEKKGFKRYSLCNLSVAEQILLFNNAEIVVSEQGSGLTNILFCKPQTTVIEIFQALIDNCFWWFSSVFRFNYITVKTLDIDVDYFTNWWDCGIDHLEKCGKSIINVPLDEINKVAEKL